MDILDTRFEGKDIELPENFIALGHNINITSKDPAMKKIHIGAGWDMNAFESEALDVDLSLFLINKDGQTREDADFVYFNNREILNGGITHNFDSRTGAGDGDDESISINLETIPFDVVQLVFVFSIYKGEENSQNLGMLRNAFIRLANDDNGFEILRYTLDKELEEKQETAMIVGTLNREGPKWHFHAKAEMIEGGLAALAQRYGLIVAQQ